MSDSKALQESIPQRHCAFCLQLKLFKVCGGCKKRAYCSPRCQKDDWSPSAKGQGHKNYCKIPCCEEDVDWEVRPVLGKGIGVVAKRLIPTMSRIIVEGIHFEPDSHPAIADLHPEGGSLGRKFQKNCLEGDEDTQGRNYIALRISRVNHSCAPNAAHNYCESSKVEILYACRDIQEGEEICFGYRLFTNVISSLPFPGMTIDTEFGSIGAVLQLKWGITCPSDCYCKDEKLKEDVVKLRSLFEKFDRLRLRCLDPTVNRSAKPYSSAALLIADDILALQEKLNASWIAKANVHSAASEIASLNPSLAKSAFDHAKKLYDIYSAVCPLSKATKTHEQKLQFASSWNI